MKLEITAIDTAKNTQILQYEILTHSIAVDWCKKIKHLQKIPLDKSYSNTWDSFLSPEDCLNGINDLAEGFCDVKNYLLGKKINQDVCNYLHTWIIENQHRYDTEKRKDIHKIHRLVHALEHRLHNRLSNFIPIGWGEKAGPLETKFEVNPYMFYEYPLHQGDIYLKWSEFGKTPYDWFIENKDTNSNNFFNECKPHHTFRAHFDICITEQNNQKFEIEWITWWNSNFKKSWISKYGYDWDEIKSFGAIPIGRYKSNFKDFLKIKEIIKVTLF